MVSEANSRHALCNDKVSSLLLVFVRLVERSVVEEVA